MENGHECPACGKDTLYPYMRNQMKCTQCDTVVTKDQVA